MATFKPQNNLRDRGQGMVEFALAIPIFLMLLMGILEIGRLLFFYSSLSAASREAARYGAASGVTDSGTPRYLDCAGMREAAKRAGIMAVYTDDQVQIVYDTGPNPTPTIIAQCNPPVATPSPTQIPPNARVVVQVNASYEPIVPLPALPSFPFNSSTSRTIIREIDSAGRWPTPQAPTATAVPNCANITVSDPGGHTAPVVTVNLTNTNPSPAYLSSIQATWAYPSQPSQASGLKKMTLGNVTAPDWTWNSSHPNGDASPLSITPFNLKVRANQVTPAPLTITFDSYKYSGINLTFNFLPSCTKTLTIP